MYIDTYKVARIALNNLENSILVLLKEGSEPKKELNQIATTMLYYIIPLKYELEKHNKEKLPFHIFYKNIKGQLSLVKNVMNGEMLMFHKELFQYVNKQVLETNKLFKSVARNNRQEMEKGKKYWMNVDLRQDEDIPF